MTREIDEYVGRIERETLREIACALDIPARNHDKAILQLRNAVRASLELSERIAHAPDLRAADRKELMAISTASKNLSQKLLNRSDAVNQVLDQSWPEEAISADQLFDALDLLIEIVVERGKSGPSYKNPILLQLVGWLTNIAKDLEGTASIDADAGSGRLIDAITQIRSLLPSDALPENLPLGSISRWKTKHEKIREKVLPLRTKSAASSQLVK